jgi:hypothetical protein
MDACGIAAISTRAGLTRMRLTRMRHDSSPAMS